MRIGFLNIFGKRKKEIDKQILLREVLMGNFLIITVFEVISKPIVTFFFESMKERYLQYGIFPFKNSFEYFFSGIAGADFNLLVVVFSLMLTGFLIGIIFRFAKLLYSTKTIKEYMRGKGRKSNYSSDFGAILLLTFMIIGLIILVLYPIFGIIILFGLIIAHGQVMEEGERI